MNRFYDHEAHRFGGRRGTLLMVIRDANKESVRTENSVTVEIIPTIFILASVWYEAQTGAVDLLVERFEGCCNDCIRELH